MQLDALLEVAIGMVFVWLILSVATMEIQNRISLWLNWRSDFLEKAIHDMLKDPRLVQKFYDHPLIQELSPKDKKGKLKRPDYIPNSVFATAAFDIIVNAGRSGETIPVDSLSIEALRASMLRLAEANPPLARTVQHIFPTMGKTVENFETAVKGYRANVENWFNNVMGQASNVYKQKAQIVAFFVGLGFALFLNIDTIYIAQKLWQDPTAREVLVAQAQSQAASGAAPTDVLSDVQSLNFPIGWTTTLAKNQSCELIGAEGYQLVIRSAGECRLLTGFPALNNGWGLVVKVFGYLLSGAAAAQGAPFWFDILRRLVGFRQQTSSRSKSS